MKASRRDFLTTCLLAGASRTYAAPRHPNILLIISDDQGFGDLSCHGNPHLKTPNLDRIAAEGIELTQFHVSPVCAPTRASLLTGRYNYRTGVTDTYLGRAMMFSDEVTLPEILRRAGYLTGIFGKWHLGDSFPLRAIDQGFDDALTHTGGGIGQPSDPPGNHYQDPILFRNGKPEKRLGYCTDIFADAAIRFMQNGSSKPFFAYLATNAPHTPLEIDESLVEPFRRAGLDPETAAVYAMVKNVDDNVGRCLAALDSAGMARDTIVIFMTDNGPQQDRYNAGMRGRKGTVYQGGIRVPFFLRWPGQMTAGKKIDRIAAHIDVLPTLLELAGVSKQPGVKMDGVSLVPLLRDQAPNWPDRALFLQWHRGDAPEPYRSSAVRTQRYKLVSGRELYDLQADPAEANDVSAAHPEVVAKLRTAYDEWFRDVSSTRGYDPPRIALGAKQENPVILTRQDWRGPKAGWASDSLGYWEVDVRRGGRYRVTLEFDGASATRTLQFKLGGLAAGHEVQGASRELTLHLNFSPGPARLEASIGDVGMRYVKVERL